MIMHLHREIEYFTHTEGLELTSSQPEKQTTYPKVIRRYSIAVLLSPSHPITSCLLSWEKALLPSQNDAHLTETLVDIVMTQQRPFRTILLIT